MEAKFGATDKPIGKKRHAMSVIAAQAKFTDLGGQHQAR
jgi:hypothetical protein